MSIDNLRAMLARVDATDHAEGQLAYARYNRIMQQLMLRFDIPLERVVAAFVSLSPNSDYHGNLRSTVSVLAGVKHGHRPADITVSTYNHCRDRAYAYAIGERDFLKETKGPKITSFYHNILDPTDTRWVTVDGHMAAIWFGGRMTMKEALVTRRQYREIKHAITALAFENFLVPCELQAILWFARKRIFRVRFEPQGDLINWANNDLWRTEVDVERMEPYDNKQQSTRRAIGAGQRDFRDLAGELQRQLEIGHGDAPVGGANGTQQG